jgi:hypothetical protein
MLRGRFHWPIHALGSVANTSIMTQSRGKYSCYVGLCRNSAVESRRPRAELRCLLSAGVPPWHILIHYMSSINKLSLCRSGQSSWLHFQRSWFDSLLYQIVWAVVGLERGPLSLVSTIEELLWRKSNDSGLESREHSRKGFVTLTTPHPSIRKSWH